MCILFAATYPERTAAMVIYGTPKFRGMDSVLSAPGRASVEEVWRKIASMVEGWGEGHSAEIFAPSVAGDDGINGGFGLIERTSPAPAWWPT